MEEDYDPPRQVLGRSLWSFPAHDFITRYTSHIVVVIKDEPEFLNEQSECVKTVKEEVEEETEYMKNEVEFLNKETEFVEEDPSLLDSTDLSCGVSEAAMLSGLYTDHVVKDEIVLGPEGMHRPKTANVSHEESSPLVGDCRAVAPRRASAATTSAAHNKALPQEHSVNRQHKLTHSERVDSCDTCQKVMLPGTLKRHKQMHTGEKPHSCEICNKQFRELSTLVIHRRTHTGERPYSCEICKKDFACLPNLIRHKKTHTGLKPYSCQICDKRFKQSGSLKAHKKRMHEVKSYHCEICKKQFISHLMKHKLSRSLTKPCCNNVFKQPYILNHSFPSLFGLPPT